MPLTLYRRHLKSCSKGYPQNQRVFKPTDKTERSKDCSCPISAEGTLELEGLITNRSTRKTSWDEAEAVAKQWETWGRLAPPPDAASPGFVTVQYAADSFLASQGPKGRNLRPRTYNAFSVLLEQRLLPYCAGLGYLYLREFDNLDVVTKFTESWVNLQPTRNRKDVPLPSTPVPLESTTKKAEVERLRYFFRYCVDRGWLDSNCAAKLSVSVKTKKKFGMEPEEEARIFAQIGAHCTDGRGGNGGYNSQQLRVFCLVMRHAGLRISDAVTLNDRQLVPRASGKGSALRIFQQKTQEWTYVPVPDWVAAELKALPFRAQKDGLRYWFWTCDGALDTSQNNWYRRVAHIIRAVAKTHGFVNPVSPHVFRHTFAIAHLNAGADVKLVSRWLGHASTAVTEKHYSHAIRSTLLASENAFDESVRRQQEIIAKRRREQMTVATGSST